MKLRAGRSVVAVPLAIAIMLVLAGVAVVLVFMVWGPGPGPSPPVEDRPPAAVRAEPETTSVLKSPLEQS